MADIDANVPLETTDGNEDLCDVSSYFESSVIWEFERNSRLPVAGNDQLWNW